MSDFAQLGITSLATATTLVKGFLAARKEYDEATYKLKFSELLIALAEAQTSIASLQEELLRKDQEVRELQEQLEDKRQLRYEAPYYYMVSDDDEKDGPFCQVCLDRDKKYIRLQKSYSETRRCEVCGNRYNNKDDYIAPFGHFRS